MSQPTSAAVSTTDPVVRRRRAIRGAFWGFLVDSFDIYLPSVALLPAMIYFTKGLSTETTALVTGLTFASTLIGRPVGAILFGLFADKLGRKRVGAIAIYGFSIVTLIIGLLPGAEQIGGGLAIGILLALRFIDGIFLGGEYTAATPMAIEYAKTNRRGLVGGFVQSASTIGYFAISLVTFVSLTISPAGEIDSPYVQWGWRIPFFVGAIFAFVVARFLRNNVEESVIWENAKKSENPLREMLSGENRTAFIQVFLLMTGVFFMVNMVGSVLPQLVLAQDGFTGTTLTVSLIVGNIFIPAAYWGSGLLSDKVGRRPVLIGCGALVVLVMTTLFAVLGTNTNLGLPYVITIVFFLNAVNAATIGTLPSYINERFPTSVRSSGWGIGYSLAVIIPGFFAFYQLGLAQLIPSGLTAAVLVAVGGLLIIITVALSPETRGTDLNTASMATLHSKGAAGIAARAAAASKSNS
ncbi:MAG: MFS transporter [Mycobacterium sp.]